jgi:chemotaxis protein MotB
MQEKGLGDRQVAQVRGFADQLLRKPNDPFDPSNRRISLIVQYTTKEDLEQATDAVKQVTGTPSEQSIQETPSSQEPPSK